MKEYTPEEKAMYDKLARQYDSFTKTLNAALNGKPVQQHKQVLFIKDNHPYVGFKNLQEMQNTIDAVRDNGGIVEAKSCKDTGNYYQFEIKEK